MTIDENKTTLTAVEELQAGDLVQLAGDSYADEDDMGEYSDGYAEVLYVNKYGAFGTMTAAIEFLYEGLESVVAFPFGHRVPVLKTTGK